MAQRVTSDDFDPYLKWLGIRDNKRPPNHYRLLGIEIFEADPDVIASAADRQMAHVRRYQNGSHAELSQRILNEVAAAKVCLLNENTKQRYDARLRSVDSPTKSESLTSRTYALITSLLVLLGLVGWLALNRLRPSTNTPRNTPHVASDPKGREPVQSKDQTPTVTSPEPKANEDVVPPGNPTTVFKPHENEPPKPTSQPTNNGTNPWIKKKYANQPPVEFTSPFLAAIAQRDLERAELEFQSQFGSEENARSRRAGILLQQVKSFWKAYSAAVEEIRLGDMLIYRDQEVEVRSVTHASMLLRAADGSEVAFKLSRNAVESELAVALATSGLKATGHERERILRAFRYCDARDKSRFANLDVDVRKPAPNPTVDSPPSVVDSTPQPPRNPVGASLDDKIALVSVSTPSHRLANVLLDWAKGTEHIDDKSILLDRALAAADEQQQAGNYLRVVAELESNFEVGAERSTAIAKKIGEMLRDSTRDELSSMSRDFQSIVRATTRNGRFDVANRYQRVLNTFAKRQQNESLLQAAKSLKLKITATEKAYNAAQSHYKELSKAPDAPLPNLRIGIYESLVLGDMEPGMYRLLRSKNEEASEIARLELARIRPSDLLGMRWWDFSLSKHVTGLARNNAQLRAMHHFSQHIQKTGLHSNLVRQLKRIRPQNELIRRFTTTSEVLAGGWEVVWNDHPDWDSLSFHSNGKTKISSNGKTLTSMTWQLEPESITITDDQDRGSLFLLQRTGKTRLNCQKLDRRTGVVLSHGIGKPSSTSR